MAHADLFQTTRKRLAFFALAATASVALTLATGCGEEQTELQRSRAYMDSLGVFLGELRLMEHELNKVVLSDTVSADLIVPVIAERLRPTVSDLQRRTDGLRPTADVRIAHELLLKYLDLRLQAYDAALQANAESRPELFDVFAIRQIEAQEIGHKLEDESQRLISQVR